MGRVRLSSGKIKKLFSVVVLFCPGVYVCFNFVQVSVLKFAFFSLWLKCESFFFCGVACAPSALS